MRLGSRTNCGLTSVGRSVYYICCFRPLSSWTVFQRRSMCSSQPAIVQLPRRFSRTPLSVRYVSHVDFFVKYYYSLHSPVYGERAMFAKSLHRLLRCNVEQSNCATLGSCWVVQTTRTPCIPSLWSALLYFITTPWSPRRSIRLYR